MARVTNSLGKFDMSITETALMAQTNGHSSDVYDDGHLRVEHDNYYVACDGTPIKLPRTEFLPPDYCFRALTCPDPVNREFRSSSAQCNTDCLDWFLRSARFQPNSQESLCLL